MSITSRRPEVFIFEGEAKAVLPAAESFTRQGFRVVVGSSHPYCLGFYSRMCRERVIIPDQRRQPEMCREFLTNFIKRRRFEMILPLGDEVTQHICSQREELMKYTKMVLVPYETFMIGRDKIRTMKAAQKNGIPIPKTFYPHEQNFDEIDRMVTYPVLIKPAFSNGARGICYPKNKQEMIERYDKTTSIFGASFVQEFIPQEGMQYKVELLLDRDGTVLGSFAYEKIRYYPPTGGSSTLNKSIYYPELVDLSIRMARGIGWYGMCDFDFIYDIRDKQPKLMEINPRITDTIRLANYAGIDFFNMLYKMASGKKVEPVTSYRTDLYMRFLPGEFMWFLKTKGERFGARPSFFNFFGNNVRYLVTNISDLGPLMGYLLDNITVLCKAKERNFLLRNNTN
jgi:D-aspartate ligase